MPDRKSTPPKMHLATARGGKTGKFNHSSGGWDAQYVPYTVYFYYITKTGTGTSPYDVQVYMWTYLQAMSPSDVESLIPSYIANAKATTKQNQPIGYGFHQVPWWRRSYIVIALDIPESLNADDPLTIEREEGTGRSPNHTFFDGKYYVIPGTQTQIIYTINYMKNKSGEDIPKGKSHLFKFRFNPPGRPLLPIEDSGTNMGPPVPPP